MRIILLLLLLILPSMGFSQSDELVLLRGKVICPIKELAEINIYNLRSDSGTASDAQGNFTIFVKVGDTLKCSGLQVETKKVALQKSDLAKALFVIQLVPKTINLDEVEIKDYSHINAVSLGILDKPAKKYTPAERRLKTATDLDVTANAGLMAGGSIGLDPILNAISGRSAMLKKELEVEKKERLIVRVESLFNADYLTEKLKIPQEYVKGFLYYAVEDEKLAKYINAKNKGLSKFRLGELATQYLALLQESKK